MPVCIINLYGWPNAASRRERNADTCQLVEAAIRLQKHVFPLPCILVGDLNADISDISSLQLA
eukprot:10706379-Alexandrium_andersonii.AAC.1